MLKIKSVQYISASITSCSCTCTVFDFRKRKRKAKRKRKTLFRVTRGKQARPLINNAYEGRVGYACIGLHNIDKPHFSVLDTSITRVQLCFH